MQQPRSSLSEGELGITVTQSNMETEQKHQRDKVPGIPNKEAAPASGDACRTGNQDPAASIPTVSSDASPSGCAALSSSRAGSTAAAIFIADENPGLPIMAPVSAERHSDLQACCSLHEDLGCEVPEGGSQAAVGPPPKATGHAEHPAGTKSPWNNRRRKQPCRDQGAWAQKPPGRCLFPRLLPPSSPGSQPSSRRRSQASTSSQATQPGPALLSHASEARPASQSLIALPASARHRYASAPGPVFRRCTAPPGLPFPPFAIHLDPARLSPESAPDPARLSRASAPGPARRGRASAPGPARRGRASAPGAASRGRASAPGAASRGRASAPGRALRSHTARSTPARRSTSMTPGTGLRSRSTQRRSVLLSRRSLSGPADENPSCGAGLRRLAFQSSSGSPDPEMPSRPSAPVWHAVRMRASSPSPPGRYFIPIPQQWDESSSSSSSSPSRSPGTSPSSSPTKISGQSSSSSSPEFLGLRSISTPSPASLRRALMPELYAPSPVPPEEQAEIESTAHPPPLPEL
ncbi:EZH inhibitory protein [Sapajus apella]|uniref:EZH inhibitory protein n=1 Tax=Sapajus apella TaxID=9515 RepID=A0A6J3HA66_SAPAP|nr:EZH inhibitory protein [Sapajus apella]